MNSHVVLKIYNVLGQEVKTLVDEIRDAGYESVEWDASKISSGIYFYKLEAVSVTDAKQSFVQLKKALLLK